MSKIKNQEKELLKQALSAMKNAHLKRSSGTKVGAAILTSNNNYYGGCNIESKIAGLGISAERCAIAHGIIHEGSQMKIQMVAVVIEGNYKPRPCGACLQYISEFCETEIPIVMAKARNGELIQNTLEVLTNKEMLPYSFDI